MNFFFRSSPIKFLEESSLKFIRRLGRATGKGGVNVHRSNNAKKGLYHGRDIQFGNSISHSHTKFKRRWYPNVINKRVWSDALDKLVRFKMTTAALKAIDDYGGIDNYLLSLDEPTVRDSNYVTKMRGLVATALFSKGLLTEKQIKKMKYHQNPPNLATENGDNEPMHLKG